MTTKSVVKHMPGPWNIKPESHTFSVLVPSMVKETYDAISGRSIKPADKIIARVSATPGIDREIGEANARLIAAAPELLELLKDVGTWLETHLEFGHINAGTANRNGDLVSQIRAVIAKAEGK